MRIGSWWAGIAVLVAAGALAPAAHAATIQASDGNVVFTAAPGEANDVTVKTVRGADWATTGLLDLQVADAGAPLAAGPGCEQLAEPSTVYCRQARSLLVAAGNRDDRVLVDDRSGFGDTAIYGQEGNDSLTVSSSVGMSPVIDGGSGDDTLTAHMNSGRDDPILRGRGGDDLLQLLDIAGGNALGGSGDDKIVYFGTPRPPAPLALDGETGNDTYAFSYKSWPAAIVPGPGVDTLDESDSTYPLGLDLDLSACPGCVERVIGSPQDDHITGDAGAQAIFGGPGNDVIDGGGGPDLLSGDAGDDSITSVDGVFDVVGCGDGADVATADRFDLVSWDCETVSRGATPQP